MAMDLLDFLSRGLGGDFAARVTALTGENSQGTQTALDAVLPLLVAGAARKSSTSAGASELLGLINRYGTDPAQLASIGKLLSGNNLGSLTSAGSNILTGLFGDRTHGLSSSLGNLAGIRPGSATTLLSVLAPLVFGLLRGHAAREGLGATGIARLLQGQRDMVAKRVPEGLANTLGWGLPSTWFGSARPPVVEQQTGRNWTPWILVALAVLGLLFLLTRCGKEPAVTSGPVAAPAGATAPGRVKVYFDAGSAAPAPQASSQLDAIVAYAKAHAGARVSVSGYNDPSGDAAANEELARNRALAIRNVLVGRGVSEDKVDMNKPLAATGVTEEREARRVEVSLQ